ncbi:MAG: hypothetical protein QNK05_00115 [Myxococcota bacterium]|nr:hypothetical protein [Myxococcota bacterium]
MLRFTTIPLAALLLSLAVPTGSWAQPGDAALAAVRPGGSRIELANEGPTPARAEVPRGDRFTLVNASETSARVVFDKKAVKRVTCMEPDAQTGRRGQYLVRSGQVLSCSLEGGDARYSVYRQLPGGSLDVTKGRVDLGS